MTTWFWFWLVMGALLIVAEMFTAGFFLLPFGIGAVTAAVLEYFGVAAGWQWLAFIAVSVVALFGLRRFAEVFTHDQPVGVGVDRVIGKTGVVVEELDEAEGKGRVRIDREEWRADAPGYEPLPKGTRIVVERVEGTRLITKPVETAQTAQEG